jgi:hypothetical protein
MPVKHTCSHIIVAIGKNRRAHLDFLTANAPDRMTSAINLRSHILNYDALSAIAQLHGDLILNGEHYGQGLVEAKTERAAQQTPRFAN